MAKPVKALITPEVLKWVREKRIRLPMEDAAERLKLKSKQLEEWEDGTDQPTFSQLKKVGKLYKTHISVFYLPEPPTDFKLPADNRRIPTSYKPDADQAYRLNANIIEAYERRETLIELYELLEERPPQVALELSEDNTPEQAAEKIKNFLQLNEVLRHQSENPSAALKFWKRTVESTGILVCQTSANSHLSVKQHTVRGFCIGQKPHPVIVVNTKDNPYSRIFTIIHELVHIGLGKSVIQNLGDGEDNFQDWSRTEVFCNRVAGEFLVPTDELLEIVNLHELETDLPRLSKHFTVNPEVIMRRLETLDYVSKSAYQAYRKSQQEKYKDTSPMGGFVPYPYHRKLLNASGEHFARTAFMAYYEKKITLADLASAFSRCDTKHLFEIESIIFP